MKVKTLLKAAASAAVGALMLGATLSGAALAQNLGDLPAPFVQNGQMNTIFAVGSKGTDAAGIASDIAGAIETAAAFGQATIKQTTATAAGGSVTIEQAGGVGLSEKVHFGQFLAKLGSESQFDPTLKHDDLALIRETPSSSAILGEDGSTYDFKEELRISTTANKVAMDEGHPGVEIADGGLDYMLVFDDSLDSDADTTTITCTVGGDDDIFPLKNIIFLGSEVEIKCSDFDGAMTVSLGTRTTLTQGQTITTGDYQVTLTGLDTRSGVDKALITATKGGSSESVSLEQDEVGTVFNGGLSVKIKSTFQGSAGAQATIVVGTALDDTVTDGEEYQGLADWNWVITAGSDSKPEIGITFEPVDSLTGENMLVEGGSLDFPGGTLSILNQGFTLTDIGNFDVDSKSATSAYQAGTKLTSVKALELDFSEADGDKTDSFTVGKINTDDVPVNSSSLSANLQAAESIRLYYVTPDDVYVTYKDHADSKWKEGANYTNPGANVTVAMLRYDTTLIYITACTNCSAADQTLWIEVRDPTTPATIIDTIALALEFSTGIQIKDTETGTLVYTYGTGTADAGWPYSGDYSNNDDGFYTQWGLRVADPKSDVEGRRLRVDVPNDRQKIRVLVGSSTGAAETELGVGDNIPGTTASIKSVNAAGATSMEVVPISAPIAKIDSEVSDTEKTSTNLLLFGGPAVNMLVQQLGIQASEFKDASGNPIGKIKLISGAFGGPYTAAVVAGWDAINTRMASYVLAHYKNYASTFAGKSEVTVAGTTTSALTVA